MKNFLSIFELKIFSSKTISGHKSNTHITFFDFVNFDKKTPIKELVTGEVPKENIKS